MTDTRDRSGRRADEEFLDDAFRILADARRRAVVRYLDEAETPVGILDLVDEVVARELAATESEDSDEVADRVYLELYHRHLPKLADVGAVKYGSDERELATGEAFDRLAGVLASADGIG